MTRASRRIAAPETGGETAALSLARRDLRLLVRWVPVAYLGFFVLLPLRFSSAEVLRLAPLSLASIAILFALRAAVLHNHGRDLNVHQLLASVVGVVLLDHLLRSLIVYTPTRTVSLGLLLVGTGVFVLSSRWFAGLLAAGLAAGGALEVFGPGPQSALATSVPSLGTAAIIAVLAHVTRIRTVDYMDRLRRRDQRHLHEARENAAKLRAILDRIHDIFFRTRTDGTIEMLSPSVERYGYRAADLIGGNSLPFYPAPEDRERLLSALLANGQLRHHEVVFRRKDGGRVVAALTAHLVRDDNGKPIALEGLLHDISDLKQREERQRAETWDAAALARVGRELIAPMQESALLDRLCSLSREVFACDVSRTFLIEGDDLVQVAGAGCSEHSVQPRVHLPLTGAAAELVRTLQREVVNRYDGSTSLPLAAEGMHTILYFALRRGEEVVGFQSVEYRTGGDTLSKRRIELARRIGHLASLALESARLVQKLERANQFKTTFLANMSHELRTPINVIIGYQDILLDGAAGPLSTEQSTTLERSQQTAVQLLNLVSAALELSREEALDVPIRVREFSVPAFLDELATERRALPLPADVRLTFESLPGVSLLRSDQRKLAMILKNLIDNAVKFTARGQVTVSAGLNDNGVEFQVTDSGIGIPAEERERIFEPFEQGSGADDRSGGVGLGLYIVRRLTAALGGHVKVRSKMGRGSTFCLWIPQRGESVTPPPPIDGAVRHRARGG